MDTMEKTVAEGIEYLKNSQPDAIVYEHTTTTRFSNYLKGTDRWGCSYEVADRSRPSVSHSSRPANLAAKELSRVISQNIGSLSSTVALAEIFDKAQMELGYRLISSPGVPEKPGASSELKILVLPRRRRPKSEKTCGL